MGSRLALDVRSGATVGALLGALVEAGASLSRMERDLESLGPGAVPIAVRRSAAGSSVRLHAPRDTPPQRPWGEQRDRLAMLAVDDDVVEVALAMLERLARTRARVRGVPLGEVEADPFGGRDETAGALALASAVSSLGSPIIGTTAIGLGSGVLRTAVGEVVLPGPVVGDLLVGRRQVARPFAVELVDPVAAAFIAATTAELPLAVEESLGVRAADIGNSGRGVVHTRHGDVGVVLAVAGP